MHVTFHKRRVTGRHKWLVGMIYNKQCVWNYTFVYQVGRWDMQGVGYLWACSPRDVIFFCDRLIGSWLSCRLSAAPAERLLRAARKKNKASLGTVHLRAVQETCRLPQKWKYLHLHKRARVSRPYEVFIGHWHRERDTVGLEWPPWSATLAL